MPKKGKKKSLFGRQSSDAKRMALKRFIDIYFTSYLIEFGNQMNIIFTGKLKQLKMSRSDFKMLLYTNAQNEKMRLKVNMIGD